MSHWLSNVNNLLTKLDDQVETVVEERAFAQDDLSCEAIDAAKTGIDDILAKRGLSSMDSKDEMDEDETKVEKNLVEEDEDNKDDKQCLKYENDESKAQEIKTVNGAAIKSTKGADTSKTVSQPFDNDAPNKTAQIDMRRQEVDKLIEKSSTFTDQKLSIQPDPETNSSKGHVVGKPIFVELDKRDTNSEEFIPQKVEKMDGEIERKPIERHKINASPMLPTISKFKDQSMPSLPPSPQIPTSTTSAGSTVVASSSLSFNKEQKRRPHAVHSPDRSRKEIRELVIERKEAQKEARTLRRHIVSLNDQFETAELELQAQRKELERAAGRMEKNRLQHKEEKEASQKRGTTEITLLQTRHEKSLKEQQARFEEQLERYRKKLSDEEKQRKQQGGNWDKEMSNAIDREHNMRQTLDLLEDEKAVLLSQISTLQGQQTALGSRLESLSQAADNAMQRECDVENRLDVALNQHARQIGHRQARESQLERTIQDLNAALVVSRGNRRLSGNNSPGCDGGFDDPLRGNSYLEARISALESNLQTANSHLAIEKERSETLQTQLRSFSNETTQEATIVHAKEIQYDRQIADMAITISKLEVKVRQYEKALPNKSNTPVDSLNDQKMPEQIKVLSEEVVRLRDKIANHNSESLATKNRLKEAVVRSNKLEEELQIAKISSNSDGVIYDSTVQGHNTASGGRRRNFGASSNGSIRTAMLLNSSRGDRTEQIGQAVDQLDSFAASTGKYLRKNPLARAGFIFYLISIHLWTFVLLFFHAHSFNSIPEREFGNVGYAHGPHAIMQQQLIKKDLDLTINADGIPLH